MNSLPSGSYSAILHEAMESFGVGCRAFEELLIKKGYDDISYKRISEYMNGLHTPTFEKAKIMLSVLDFDIEDGELMEALKINRQAIKEESKYLLSDSREIRRTVRIPLGKLIPDKGAEEAETILKQRIEDLYGDERQISLYLKSLVSKDLQEFILTKEEKETDED